MKDIDILIKVCDYLIDNEIVKNQKEFAEIIGETNAGWYDLKKEKKKTTINHLRAVASKFKDFNRNFLFMGEGKLINKTELDENPLIDDYVNNLIENNNLLKEKIKRLESEIEEYKNRS